MHFKEQLVIPIGLVMLEAVYIYVGINIFDLVKLTIIFNSIHNRSMNAYTPANDPTSVLTVKSRSQPTPTWWYIDVYTLTRSRTNVNSANVHLSTQGI